MPMLPSLNEVAAGAATEQGRRPTVAGVPGMGTGLEVKVLRGASW
jgi:hypothetical protein